MRNSDSSGCCCSCIKTIFLAGLSFLATYLFYRLTTKSPRFYISDLHIPPPPPTNANLTYELQIRNMARFLGIYYDDLSLSVRYANATSNTSLIPAFYQGHHKTAQREGGLSAGWVPNGVVSGAANGSTAAFRVALEGKFRYKAVLIWRSGRYGVRVEGDVEVDGEGKWMGEDWIQLRSAAPPAKREFLPCGCAAAAATAAAAVLLSVL